MGAQSIVITVQYPKGTATYTLDQPNYDVAYFRNLFREALSNRRSLVLESGDGQMVRIELGHAVSVDIR